MPFTFSHPAIVLPLAKLRWLSFTGLVIGSMTPDFEYFLRLNMKSLFSHTFYGVFLFDLPLGLLLCFLFHQLIRQPLIENCPKFLQARWKQYYNFSWSGYFRKNALIVLCSILLGAFSHVFWDSFTHKGAYFVEYLPFLTRTLDIVDYQIPYYKIGQHGSTLIGGFMILLFVIMLPKSKDEVKMDSRWYLYWFAVGICAILFVLLRLYTGLELYAYGSVIVNLISGVLLGLILVSAFYTYRKKKLQKQS